MMPKLVSSSQMAFLKGRQIMYADLTYNECLNTKLGKKKPGIMCKLDIEKA